jgi:hypothetical protein
MPAALSAILRFVVPCAAALTLLSAAPSADAGTVGLHLISAHLPKRNFDNFNPGLYYRSDGGWITGVYNNSLSRASVYGGYSLQYRALALTVGAVTGYEHAVQVLVVPSVALFTVQGVTTRIAFIPRVEKRIASHVLHLMAEF